MSQEEREALERVVEAVKALVEAFIEAFAKALKPFVNAVAKWLWPKIRKAPPRVVYLAFHHKKQRIRKKNFVRMLSYD